MNECASSILSGCEHGCVNTLTSFRCTCRSGYKLAPNQKNCWGKFSSFQSLFKFHYLDINECVETPSVCQQLCENTPGNTILNGIVKLTFSFLGSYICKCAPGYIKSVDGRNCYRTNRMFMFSLHISLLFHLGTIVPYVFYTNKYYVRAIDLDEQTELMIARDFIELSSIAYDWKDRKLYVGDTFGSKIYRMNLNGTQSTAIIEGNSVRFLRALAFDWIGRKLYRLMSTPEIRVSELDGRNDIVLLNSRYLAQPNYLAIDSLEGYLFYSDWGQAHIGRINLDGSNFMKIIGTDTAGPLGLTVDIITKRIFWIDRRLQRVE